MNADEANVELPIKPAKSVRYMLLFVTDEASRLVMGQVLHDYFRDLNQYFDSTVCLVWPEIGTEASRLSAVLKKNWSGQQKDLIQKNLPCLLIFDQDGPSFDPQKHKWAVVNLQQLLTNDGNIDRSFSVPFSEKIIRICNDSELDLFYYLGDLKFQERLKNLGRLIEIKPGIFGAKFNIKAFIDLF